MGSGCVVSDIAPILAPPTNLPPTVCPALRRAGAGLMGRRAVAQRRLAAGHLAWGIVDVSLGRVAVVIEAPPWSNRPVAEITIGVQAAAGARRRLDRAALPAGAGRTSIPGWACAVSRPTLPWRNRVASAPWCALPASATSAGWPTSS